MAARFCDPRVRDVLPGQVIFVRILKAPEPTGRAACCPLRFCQPTAPLRRETCEDKRARAAVRGCGPRGLISLEHGRSTARSEFTRPRGSVRQV